MRGMKLLPTLAVTTAVSLGPGAVPQASAAVIQTKAALQQALHTNLEQRKTSFTVTASASLWGSVSQAMNAALHSDPYLANDYESSRWGAALDGSLMTIHVNMRYRETAAQYQYVQRRVEQILQQIIKPRMLDVQKELAIHDYIVLHAKYDTTLQHVTPYDLLTKGTAVCQGYQMLTYLMLTRAGIPCKMVNGTADGGSHGWVMVKIAGQWYHLDTTWDDPVPDQPGRVRYAYFNLTDAQMARDHAWNHTGLPPATTDFLQTVLAHSEDSSDAARAWRQVFMHTGEYLETDAYTFTDPQKLAAAMESHLSTGTRASFSFRVPVTLIPILPTLALPVAVRFAYQPDPRDPGYDIVTAEASG
ncbi:MAG: transglutaminase [Alicyclobacillaceae bacterium]|nr:transglutaminase [Alicyclobacillaceae bacterium]